MPPSDSEIVNAGPSTPTAESSLAKLVKLADAALDRVLRLLSSVRFGVFLLALLILSCFLGMAVMQQNVQGFETYYGTLTNSEKVVFNALGLFNVYGTWWFQTLLALVSLTIILASIDHFPAAWRYVSRPKRVASVPYLKRQALNVTLELEGESQKAIADRIATYLRSKGLRSGIVAKGAEVNVFAQRHPWNRLGAYFVHVALLTIFTGGFLTSRFGQVGQMPLAQGEEASQFQEFIQQLDGRGLIQHQLPFLVHADKIEQTLLNSAGSLDPSNTLDWRTYITIVDAGEPHKAVVHLNKPFDYKGYRFFQSGFDGGGDASSITLSVSDRSGNVQSLEMGKGEPVVVEGLGTLTFVRFIGDFDRRSMGPASDGYDNPTAFIRVQTTNGADTTIPAFNADFASELGGAPRMPGNGMSLRLDAYAKANSQHVLSVQKDPGATVFYVGGVMVALALSSVFFFAHQRVWAIVGPVTDGRAQVTMGGHANRHKPAFEERFMVWTRALVDPASENRERGAEEVDDDE